MLYIRKNRTQAVREVPQTNPRGKVFCGGSAVWFDCKRCDASRISGIGKRMVQRNTDKEILTIEKDEYPSEEQDNTETKETTADDNYEAVLQTTDAAALKMLLRRRLNHWY